MKINLAKSAGFCFGVRRAIKIAYDTAQENSTIEMLGDIVHNEEVVRKIRNLGINKISELRQGRNKILLIRAHGSPKSIFEKARKLRYIIVDATCPMVKDIHKKAIDAENKDYSIIVIGDKKHDEVKGIFGQLKNKAIVIDSIRSIPYKKIKSLEKAAVVVQSTQNIDKVNKIANILKRYIKDFKFFNTVCRPTRIKQDEIKKLPLENDAMIIIGSKRSANTKRLYEISKSLNKNSYWIQSKKDIKPAWLKGVSSMGITAGASTPNHSTNEVINYIKKII